MTTEQQSFISSVAKYVQKYAPSYGIKVCSPIIAQAILESAWGKSALAAKYHNYFGMKCGTKWTGKSVNMKTQEEYTAGTYTTISSNFRAYDSMEEGIKGYFEFIQLSRYQNLRGITDPQKYLETIKADGYATSSKYVTNNMNVVTTYGLTKYDTIAKGSDTTVSSKTDKAIEAVIAIATNEIGYLEKASNANLDDKTANAGSANYTKYWRDVYPSYQKSAWCACFVSWCFMKAFGLETAKKLLKHWPYVYCPTLGNLFIKNANPKVGDIVIFYRNGTFAHTGIVTKVSGDQFWTIEGNTSGASGIIANGGGVCAKSYYNSKLPGTKFCTPDYSIVTTINTTASSTSSTSSTTTTSSTYSKTKRWTGTITADSLNVRVKPGTGNATCSFSPLKKGTEVDVCDTTTVSGTEWLYIKYNGKYGFAVRKYIKKKSSSKTTTKTSTYSEWVGEVTASSLNVREGAGSGKAIQTAYPKLTKGNRIRVLSEEKASDGSTWYKIVINNSVTNNKDVTGYVSAKYVKKV